MRFLSEVLVICLLTAAPAFAQTVHNDPGKNIFDTFDPICDGSDPSIVFCDGFEDGTWLPENREAVNANTDYWKGDAWTDDDPTGRGYAVCGTANSTKSDFGAAGTPCTSSTGWGTDYHGRNGAHYMTTQPGNPNSPGAPLKNFYVRLYFKLAGTTSTYCSGGWPNCQSFSFSGGPNGPKSFEFGDRRETGGISYHNFGVFFDNNGTDGNFQAGLSSCSGESNSYNNSTAGCENYGNCEQQGQKFNYYDHLDEWIYIEMHIDQTRPAGQDVVELWVDSCGRDGKSCPATPTRRMNYRTLDLDPKVSGCSTPDSIWLNWWQSSPMRGEIQHDEIVVRNGEILDQPIGFFGGEPVSGPTRPAAPTILPE